MDPGAGFPRVSTFGRRIAERLERGEGTSSRLSKLAQACAARLWSAGIERPLVLPAHVRAIGVGGATLGGSSKTPTAIALCRALSEHRADVAFVGHAHGANPGRARIVLPTDSVREVGDESLVAASALHGRVLVVVGPSRQRAAELALRQARVLVFDGLLQTRPARLSRSILALNATAPWGAARVPPFGDLRAPADRLLEAADVVAWVSDEHEPEEGHRPSDHGTSDAEVMARVPFVPVNWSLRADAGLGRPALVLEQMQGARLGLLVGLARPDRIVRALRLRGISPALLLAFADHALPSPAFLKMAAKLAESHRLDAWLATSKCRTRLPSFVGERPVLELRQELELTQSATRRLLGPLAQVVLGR